MLLMKDTVADVQEQKTLRGSVMSLLQAIKVELDKGIKRLENDGDRLHLVTLSEELDEHSEDMAKAVTANTSYAGEPEDKETAKLEKAAAKASQKVKTPK